MAAKKKVDDQYCVVALTRRALDTFATVYGPFTKAQAYVVAAHRERFEGEQCQVEELEPLCEHNNWILEGV